MPTTFSVISLGNLTSIDTTEGNYTAENAGDLVGSSFGGPGDALANQVQTFTEGAAGSG